MTDRTTFTISLPTDLKLFADGEAAQRLMGVEDLIATLLERERSYRADDDTRRAMEYQRDSPGFNRMVSRLRDIRDEMGRDKGVDMIRRILRCATGKNIDLIKISDAGPDHYDKIVELVGLVEANGLTWPEVPSNLCGQDPHP